MAYSRHCLLIPKACRKMQPLQPIVHKKTPILMKKSNINWYILEDRQPNQQVMSSIKSSKNLDQFRIVTFRSKFLRMDTVMNLSIFKDAVSAHNAVQTHHVIVKEKKQHRIEKKLQRMWWQGKVSIRLIWILQWSNVHFLIMVSESGLFLHCLPNVMPPNYIVHDPYVQS